MSTEKRRIAETEKRVQLLEDRIRMLMELVDADKYPFMFLALEYGLTMSQVDQIFKLMEEVSKAIFSKKTPMAYHEFEERVYEIVPTRRNDHHFAESIVRTLNKTGQYTEVYQHMKKSGMNLK